MRLSDACLNIVDCEHRTAPAGLGAAISVGTKDIARGRIDFRGAKRVADDTWREWSRRLTPQEGDLIFAREAPIGEVGRVPVGWRVCLGQRTVLLRPDTAKVEPRFLQYLLLGREMQAAMQASATGSTVLHLNVKDIRELELPELPSRPRQSFIANLLGALDDKAELNLEVAESLVNFGNGLFREERKSWSDAGTLDDIAKPVRDSIAANSAPPDLPYVGLDNMAPGSPVLTNWLTGEDAPTGQASRFRDGDLLFGKLRPYFKKVAVAPIVGRCSTEIVVLRPTSDEYWGPMVGYVMSDEFISHCIAVSRGTKMPRSEWEDASRFAIDLPTSEQAQQLTDQIRPLHDLATAKIHESRVLNRLRDGLLPQLLSGEFEVPVNPVITSVVAADEAVAAA